MRNMSFDGSEGSGSCKIQGEDDSPEGQVTFEGVSFFEPYFLLPEQEEKCDQDERPDDQVSLGSALLPQGFE